MAKAKEAGTLYRMKATIQKDGFGPHTPDDEPDPLAEFDAGWLAWAVANQIIVIVDGDAPTAEGEPVAADGPVYMEHFHGDPAKAPAGTWEHKWRLEREVQDLAKTAKAAPKGADKE